MPVLSAFADEISPELDEQLDVLGECGIRWIDLRGAWGANVMELTDQQVGRIQGTLKDRGFAIAAIGSPIGKSAIDKEMKLELERLKRGAELAEAFDAKYIRVFSYYPPEGQSIATYGQEVLGRMAGWVEWIAANHPNLVLVHENEYGIYGDLPERCEQIMARLYGPHMINCYDPANFVHSGVTDVFENCWMPLKKYTKCFHLKDYKRGEHVVPCGEGDGEVEKTLADAWKDGFDGFMTMEPHLTKAGQFAGFTGPDRFKAAVQAVKDICKRNGIPLR
ncbi:MAG: TIM barrel protein [Phycisphaerae bacterium]|nr:TIM barrel protein [Phycisphaerae bacterium]